MINYVNECASLLWAVRRVGPPALERCAVDPDL